MLRNPIGFKVWSVLSIIPGGFPGGSDSKASVYHAGDPGSIPGLGRSPGEGNGNPLQDYCLENPMHRGAWWATAHGVAESRTPLSDNFTFKHHPVKHHTLPLQWYKLPLRVIQRLGREVSFITADFFKDQISIATARKLFCPAAWTSIVSIIIGMSCHSDFLLSSTHGPSSELLIRFCLILLWAVSRLDGEMLWLHWGMVEAPAVFFVKALF